MKRLRGFEKAALRWEGDNKQAKIKLNLKNKQKGKNGENQDETKGRQLKRKKANTKKAAQKKQNEKNNDLILENMHNMIAKVSHDLIYGRSDAAQEYATLPPPLRPQRLCMHRERNIKAFKPHLHRDSENS